MSKATLTEVVTVRVTKDELEKIDLLRRALTGKAGRVSRSDVMKLALKLLLEGEK